MHLVFLGRDHHLESRLRRRLHLPRILDHLTQKLIRSAFQNLGVLVTLGAQQFQHLLESEPALFAVFAGSRKLETLRASGFESLLDVSRYIKISFLNRAEAMRLIVNPAQGMLTFATGVPGRILELTGGHPFYTQLLCQSLFDMVQGSGEVRPDHVEEAVRQFLLNPQLDSEKVQMPSVRRSNVKLRLKRILVGYLTGRSWCQYS